MSELSRRIQDRTPRQPPLLSESLALAVEEERLSYTEALVERERIVLRMAELDQQRRAVYAANERLDAEDAALRAENARLRATIETLASQSLADRERLIVAEKAHTVWIAGLAVATLAAVIVAISIIR